MSADEAFLTTEKIRATFDTNELQLKTSDGAVHTQITMSDGVASYPNLADNERELIRNAHAALFRAKTAGGRAPLFRNRSAWNPRPSTLAPASSAVWGSWPI